MCDTGTLATDHRPLATDLTVAIAAKGEVWVRRAQRALESIRRHAPDVWWRLATYRGDIRNRFDVLAEVETPWVLYLDADVLAAGSVLEIPRAEFVTRKAPIHGHPTWHEDRYEQMLADFGLPYRSMALPGCFLASRHVASIIARRHGYWMDRSADRQREVYTRKASNKDTFSLTLALAEAGITDAETVYVGPDIFSFHTHGEPAGIVHHFSSGVYARLEAKDQLWSELEARRP